MWFYSDLLETGTWHSYEGLLVDENGGPPGAEDANWGSTRSLRNL